VLVDDNNAVSVGDNSVFVSADYFILLRVELLQCYLPEFFLQHISVVPFNSLLITLSVY